MKHRGTVMSRKGMVASAHSLISSTGVDILRKGGNAVDAAVAMANTSGVVLPNMCGIGGDTFMLYYDSTSKKITALNGSGPACNKATIEYYTEKYGRMPLDGIDSVTIPGFVETSFTALERFGTMKFSELCADAIDLAEHGCPISEDVYKYIIKEEGKLNRFDALKKRFSNEDGAFKLPGELYFNKDLANTFKILANEGKESFYRGKIAKMIVDFSKKKGGLIEMDDMSKSTCEIADPISVKYRNMIVYQTPPVSQGIAHLEELNILNQIDFSNIQPESAHAIHIMVEAKKMAFADRIRYFGDPKFVYNPTEEILNEEYGKKQAKRISMNNCLTDQDLVDFDEFGHTTSFVVVDKWGNAVSFITSIAGSWGSGEEVEGAGFILNNRASAFNLKAGHPNCLKVGKRTMHTLNTYLITDAEGNLKFVGNTPGGDNQPQWNMQTIVNVIDFQMNVQDAVETAKWTHAFTKIEDGSYAYRLKIEKQLGEDELKELDIKGHLLDVFEPYGLTGASQIIEVRENGVLFGGSDPRADGCAMPE